MSTPFLLAFLSLVMSLSGTLCAQRHMTLPSGYLKHAPASTDRLGTRANERIQFFDTGLWSPATILRVDYRHATKGPNSFPTGVGRSWSNVQLTLAEGKWSFLSHVWTQNYAGPGSLVFSAKVSWPTIKPSWTSPWGQLGFPCSAPFRYSGKNSLLFDYQFRGGRLANGATWGTGMVSYTLAAPGDPRGGGTGDHGNAVPRPAPQCPRSVFSTYPPATHMRYYLYGHEALPPWHRGRFTVTCGLSACPKQTDGITLLAYGGSHRGVDIGALCNRLHVDPAKLLALLPSRTGNSGSSTTGVSVKYQDRFAGHHVWAQSVWMDRVFQRPALTAAVWFRVPESPGIGRKKCHHDLVTKSGVERQITWHIFTLPRLTLQ